MDFLPGQGRTRNATAVLTALARQYKKEMTPAERALWQAVRNRKLDNLRICRQYAVGTFILDFYCPTLRLAIEVDGSVHDDPAVAEHDRLRQDLIEQYGWGVLRLRNETILNDLPAALDQIRSAANTIRSRH